MADFERKEKRFGGEVLATHALRALTYFIVLVFALIAVRIVIKGTPVFLKDGFRFLSKSPELLVGFHDENNTYHRLTGEEFKEYQKVKPLGLVLAKETAEHVGGGIVGPLIGTICLVVTSLILALLIGVAAALFLSEYSKRGPFLRIVRSAVFNLAGVPSIVFGLFGLAFFCYFVPVITKSIPAERSVFYFELPSWIYPETLADEGYRIDVADSIPESGIQKIIAAEVNGELIFSIFNGRGEVVKRVGQSEIDATKPTWVDISSDLAAIKRLRDERGAREFYRGDRTREEDELIDKFRPLLKLERRLWLSFQGWEPSLIAAASTLACMILPMIIIGCEKSLRAVPQGVRDAALALGATHWQTIRKTVLPFALPGMLIASLLAIIRVAGATAPIIYTGAMASTDLGSPDLKEDGVWKAGEFLQRGCEALSYHIYIISAEIPRSDLAAPMQDGAVLAIMVLVMLLAGASVFLRSHIGKNRD